MSDFTPEPSDTKLARMSAAMVAAGYSAASPSLGAMALAPAARELAEVEIRMAVLLDDSFVATASADMLLAHAADLGMAPLPATPAKGSVVLTGVAGTVVPAGWRVRTAAAPGTAVVEVTTDAPATLAGNIGTLGNPLAVASVAATATVPGAAGNIPPGALKAFDPVSGLVGATNPQAFADGFDTETIEQLRSRVLQRLALPSSSGNRADYLRWALEVPGVGYAAVVGQEFGAGTVGIHLVGSDGLPAATDVVDAVLDHIAGVWRAYAEAEGFARTGAGATAAALPSGQQGLRLAFVSGVDAFGEDATLQTTRLAVAGVGVPGVWRAVVHAMATAQPGGTPVPAFRIEVWNYSTAAFALTKQSGGVNAVSDYTGASLPTSGPIPLYQDFYYDGLSNLALRVRRRNGLSPNDAATVFWVDRVEYRSAFSPATGEGLAPVNARVYTMPATAVPVLVTAILIVAPDRDPLVVAADATGRVQDYLRATALSDDKTVRYVRVLDTLLATPGVVDVAADPLDATRSSLYLNTTQANIAVTAQQVGTWNAASAITARVGA